MDGWRGGGQTADGQTGWATGANPVETNSAQFLSDVPIKSRLQATQGSKSVVPGAPPAATDRDAPACPNGEGHCYGRGGPQASERHDTVQGERETQG